MKQYVLALVAGSLLVGLCHGATMDTLFDWQYIDFTFPNQASRHAMIHQGLYDPKAAVPLDVDYWEDRIFLTFPNFKPGIPASLVTVSHHGNAHSPLVSPYPSWPWHRPGHCEEMTSVFRIKIDECGRLWVIDTGSVNIFLGIKHVCPKQILVFDLHNDKLLRRHVFPQSVIKPDTILTTIVVDVRDKHRKCRDTFAYVADTTTQAIIVYDAKHDRSWRISANNFWPEPAYGNFDIAGSRFNLMDGVLGLALSPNTGKPRTLYYHALASSTENYVSTKILQNQTLFVNNTNTAQESFKTYAKRRKGQSAAMDITSSGIMFYTELVTNTLKCYNLKLKYEGANNPTVFHDDERLQFASGLKIVKNKKGVEEVWIMTDRLQKLIDGSLTVDEVNFRILKAPVASLIRGTSCDLKEDPIRFGDDRSEEEENVKARVIFRDDY